MDCGNNDIFLWITVNNRFNKKINSITGYYEKKDKIYSQKN
jgi:hypothetical protein